MSILFRVHRLLCRSVLPIVFVSFGVLSTSAQQIPPGALDAMQWRLIGPFRGGRITSVCGVPSQPNVFYAGTPGGGVWKTDDAGRVWKPIFDHQRVASIGAVAVSPSNPNIVYVGTGEQTPGDGIYKSTDAGATWSNLGLHETHVISAVVIDPRNPDIVLAAAQGLRAPSPDRGIYKTTDGGKNWQKVLFKDQETGGADLQSDPDNPTLVYAALHARPIDPFDPAEEKKVQNAFIYKSTDEGSTWTAVEGKGLPTEPMGRLGLAVASGTNGMRVYAMASQGLYRSDDGGATWQQSTKDPRISGGGYISGVSVDPKNTDIVYAQQTSLYRSKDGGRTFEGWVGAPSGDDFHVMWINPLNPQYIILGVDQGAIVSVDGGNTWGSWYNQPTGQFYHVSTDRQFPYHVYGAQQDSGTADVPSRSSNGEITDHDWFPIGGFEFAYIEADPLNPNYVYTGGWYGTVLRYDRTTEQLTHLFVRTSRYRTANMVPIVFSPQDPHTIYIAAQMVLKTRDGGLTWKEVSPDLTVLPTKPGQKEEKPNPRVAVIGALALSTIKAGVMWAGTAGGIIQVTKDGKSWSNVSIPNLPEHSSVTSLEASHHDPAVAYAVIMSRGQQRLMFYRTRDYGQTWQPITSGIPADETGRVIREDTVRDALVYAGTEKGVYVSFDSGDHWQSLQLNLPTAPVSDLDVHGDDLVASTYGRSLWILDDITPLRQFDAKLLQADVTLLRPESTVRTRWDMYQDTPLPPETPAGKNPPDGAIIDYFLKGLVKDIKLSIYDSQNNLVREFSTTPPSFDTAPPNIPNYWFAPPTVLSTNPGLNRFVWNLRYPSPKTLRYGYFNEKLDYIEYTLADHAIPGEFPHDQPEGPYAVPGEYSLVLTVNGQDYRQPLTVTLDPRVHVSQSDLLSQWQTEQRISAQMAASYDSYNQVTTLRDTIADRQTKLGTDPAKKDAADALKTLNDQVGDIESGKPADLGVGPLNRELARLATMAESSDDRPTPPVEEGVEMACQNLNKRLAQWRDVNEKNIGPVNDLLRKYSLDPLLVATNTPAAPACGMQKKGKHVEVR